MNGKKKLVVVVLVLMMMVTAVAYAAWSDTIDVNGTATTGTFDVQFIDLTKAASAGHEGNFTASISAGDPGDPSDHVGIEILNAKPGEVYTVKFSAKNEGTIKAWITAGAVATSGTNLTAINNTLSYDSDNFRVELLDAAGVRLRKNTILPLGMDGDPDESQEFTIKVSVKGDSTSGFTTAKNVAFSYDFTYSQAAAGTVTAE